MSLRGGMTADQMRRIAAERVVREACDFVMWEGEVAKAQAGDPAASPDAERHREISRRRLGQAVTAYKARR